MVKYEINELYPSARHAYIAIGLAVKTSRPHMLKNIFKEAQSYTIISVFHLGKIPSVNVCVPF